MKYLLFGNWKCNPASEEEARQLLSAVAAGTAAQNNVEVALFPPFCYLPLLSCQNGIAFGAQNCCAKEKGAFTGEVSAKQIAAFGAKYVILGHSERRQLFGETDAQVAEKVKIALASGLKPVVCVGETDTERTAGRAEEVVKNQLKASLKDIDPNIVIVAYEPVWAIGTGKAGEAVEAGEMNKFIKTQIGQNTPILYGGSANAENGTPYLREAGYDGLLVGGVSLKPEEFIKMHEGIKELG